MRGCVGWLLVLAACGRSDLDVPIPADAADAAEAVADAVVDVDPLQPCTGSRDVFFFDLEGSGVRFLAQKVLHTNLDATWQAAARPDLTISISTGADAFSLELLTSGSQPLTAGSSPFTSSRNRALTAANK